MLLSDIRKNQKLAARRSPIYERNRFAKFMIYFGITFWAAYFVYIGVMLFFAFSEGIPNMEPYHILNCGLPFFLLIDFFMRFLLPTPVQEIKPYLLLPLPKKRVLNALLIQAGLNPFNLFWLFLFVPFAWLSVLRFYGIPGVLGYCVGIWLLMVGNGYWSMLVRVLMRQKFIYILLILPVYGSMALLEFLPETEWTSRFYMDLGEGYIEWNPLAFLGTLAVAIGLTGVNRWVQGKLIYRELARTEDNKVKHISNYSFFERYGIVGEYMRLELKLIFRNKTPKSNFWSFLFIMVMFACALAGDVYGSNNYMNYFICLYCYCVFGLMTLSRIMSFEGNYIDGLMVHKETIYNLLLAKYYLQSIFLIIPFLMMLYPVVTGTVSLLTSAAYLFFTMGPIFATIMQLAVYNDKTAVLNGGFMAKSQGNTMYQTLITLIAFAAPLLIQRMLTFFLPETEAGIALLVIGLATVATHRIWIKNIYVRLMKRRYNNMENFRNTR